MVAATVLKCILLAKTNLLVLEVPIDEYAMAGIEKTFNGVYFAADVLEGRMNSVLIRYPEYNVQTMSYSTKDYQLEALSTRLDVQSEYATIDCEINKP